MNITKLDHFVLTVKDLEKTIDFYTTVMGMEKEIFGEGRIALKYGDQKINLHELGGEYEPKANTPLPGSYDLCFISDMPIENVVDHIENCGVEIIEGPVMRTGANGAINSIYFRDPDLNLLEVANELSVTKNAL